MPGLFDDLTAAAPAAGAPPAASVPVPVLSQDTGTGAGLFDDLPAAPVPSQTAAAPDAGAGLFDDIPAQDPFAGQALTQTPVGLGERLSTNFHSAMQGTLLGAAANYLAGRLAPNENPEGITGPTPREQVQSSIREDAARADMLPSWRDTPAAPVPEGAPVPEDGSALIAAGDAPPAIAIPPSIAQGAAALTGSLAGGMLSPESLVAGPEAGAAVAAGARVLPQVAKAAGVQAVVQGGANAAAQGLNLAGGTQDEFSPAEAAQSAGMGAVIGGLHPAASGLIRELRGAKGAETPASAAPVSSSDAGLFADIPDAPKPAEAATSDAGSPAPAPAPLDRRTTEAPPAAPSEASGQIPPASAPPEVSVSPPEPATVPAEPRPTVAESAPGEAAATPPGSANLPPDPAKPSAQPPLVEPKPDTPAVVAAEPAAQQGDAVHVSAPDRVQDRAPGETTPEPAGPVPERVPESAPRPDPRAEDAPLIETTGTKLGDAAPLNDLPAAAPPGATRSPMGGVRPARDFNEGTSPYRGVFRDAGHDPDQMVSRPLPEQNRIISDHVKSTFGFKDVQVDPRQNPKEVRDQLSNFYHNGQEMAAALGMPLKALGMDGRVSLSTKPYRQPNQALGTYFPGRREISLPGRTNSFAHEWTHALDHHLSDVLAQNPAAMRLLSEGKGITEGTVGGRKFGPSTPAEGFAGVMRAIYGKDAATAAEALKLQYEVRTTKDPVRAIKAQQRLEAIQSGFVKDARGMPGKYWSRPAELLARAHEAYVGDVMERQGGDTRAIAKPYYDAAAGDPFEKLYPKDADRARIFQAFTDMHDRLRAAALLGDGMGPASRPGGLDIVDPHVWDKMADTKQSPGVWAALKREANALKNFREQAWTRLGYDAKAADPGRLSVGMRAADAGRALTYSIRGVGNAITERQPPAARKAYQAIMDKIAPAEHLRDASKAAGRYVGPVFEERVRDNARPNVNRMTNILDQNGLAKMSDTEKAQLRHILTEGDANSYVPDGASKAVPVPPHVAKAAGALRYLLDQEWERNQKAGIDVGYAKNGYFPRSYDDTKIYGDQRGFQEQAAKLHTLMFEKDVGDDPAKLLEAHGRLPGDVRDALPQDVRDAMGVLKKNLREHDRLRDGLDNGTSADPVKDDARLAVLRQEAGDLHDAHAGAVRDAYAQHAAENWFDRINSGDPADFDTRGPNASFTNGRVLPPEADTIMRDYMVNDPTVALPRYFQQSARKVAFNEMFGPGGRELDDLIRQATAGGARGEDNQAMRRLVEAVTGKQKSGLPPPVERAMNTVHALGSIALMPRAVWSSLSEPMAMLARTGNFKATGQAFANQVGDIVRTTSSKERAELANALGVTISHLHDSILADRTGANYTDSPALGRLLTSFYQRSGLTALTNSQRRSTMAAGHTALDAWSRDLLTGNARRARDAAAQFRDLGVPDAAHQDFAKWVTERDGLPSVQDLDTPGGRAWGQAISRLTDAVIQDPMRVDKPLMSQNPTGRLAFGLMSFTYSFYHKIIEHTLDLHAARIKEGYQDARAAGAGKLGALGGTAAPVARATGHVGASAAAIYAGSLASTALREAIFNQTKWQEESEKGTLGEWLGDLALQRTGVNGPLDPVIQAITGLKYERSLSSLTAGAQAGYFLQAAGDMLKPFAGLDAPNSNTSDYNAIKGAWNVFGVPAVSTLLSIAPGGPLANAGYGAAMQGLTSRSVADRVATHFVGPKGTGLDGTPPTPKKPKEPDAPAEGTGSGLLGGVPLGVADDFISPGVRVAGPLWGRLPKTGKLGLAAGGAAMVGSALSREFGKFKGE